MPLLVLCVPSEGMTGERYGESDVKIGRKLWTLCYVSGKRQTKRNACCLESSFEMPLQDAQRQAFIPAKLA
jgi:hypothetical protein